MVGCGCRSAQRIAIKLTLRIDIAENNLNKVKYYFRKNEYNNAIADAKQALEKALKETGCNVYNLGTGKGYSVLDLVKAFEKASGVKINYKIAPRRDGDIATCYSDPSKAKAELGWVAERGLEKMCEDTWRWQSQNPDGF